MYRLNIMQVLLIVALPCVAAWGEDKPLATEEERAPVLSKGVIDQWLAKSPELLSINWEYLPADPKSHPVPVFLVFAETVKTEMGDRNITATLQVRRVHYGPPELSGASFAVVCPKNLPRGSVFRHIIYPPPPLGETGYWLVTVFDGGCKPVLASYNSWGFPVRKYFSPDYTLTKEWAETVENLAARPESERVARLKELASCGVPQLAYWAISVLADKQPDGIDEFLRTLADDERVTILGQIALDEALMELNAKRWQRSRLRRRLLERWVTAPLSASEVDRVIHRLDFLAQHPLTAGVGQDDFLLFISKTLRNPQFTPAARVKFIRLVRWFGTKEFRRQIDDDTLTFQFLAEVIRTAEQPELRLAAAQILANFFSVTDAARWETIRRLLWSAEDNEVADALQQALNDGE